MHMKLVDRLQNNDRLTVGSMPRDTAPTKRAVDGVLDLVRAATEEIERRAASQTRSSTPCASTGINHLLIPGGLSGIEAPIVD